MTTSMGILLNVRGADVDTVTGVSVLNVTKPVADMEGRVTLSTTTSEVIGGSIAHIKVIRCK